MSIPKQFLSYDFRSLDTISVLKVLENENICSNPVLFFFNTKKGNYQSFHCNNSTCLILQIQILTT